MRVHVDTTLDALLTAVRPRVAAHPLPLTLRTAELPEASLLPLVRGEAFPLGSRLGTLLDVVALLEAQVTQVIRGQLSPLHLLIQT